MSTVSGTRLFQHAPLSSENSIRVLDLLPASNRRAPLECHVRQVELADSITQLDYEAVSYVWGEAKGAWPLLCDGRELLVTKNCHDALLQLRKKGKPRTLWIDAICIDQGVSEDAIKERSSQISGMGTIYWCARRVIIWLGQGDETAPSIFKLIQYMRSKDANIKSKGTRQWVRIIVSKIGSYLRWAALRSKHSSTQQSLAKFLDNPWFQRAWTFQETTFARPGIVMCGESSMDYDGFIQTLAIAGRGIEHHVWGLIDLRRLSFSKFGWAMQYSRSQQTNAVDQNQRFRELKSFHTAIERPFLTSIRDLRARLPQDKIYGLYSVLEASGIILPTPNYEKSAVEVFQEAAVAFILCRCSLGVLTITLPAEVDTGLPSWTPNWLDSYIVEESQSSFLSNFGPFKDKPWQATSHSIALPAAFRMSAAHPSEPLAKELITERILDVTRTGRLEVNGKVLGIVRDEFNFPSSESSEPQMEDVEFTSTCIAWCKMVKTLFEYPSGETPLEAAYGVLMACHSKHRSITFRSNYQVHFRSWFELMLSNEYNTLSEASTAPFADKSPDRGNLSSPSSKAADFNEQLCYTASCTLFLLDTGYLGTTYHTCKKGDTVALLAGLDHPIVLRRQEGNRYRVVAPAYVQGVMYGELWDSDEAVDLEDIVLV